MHSGPLNDLIVIDCTQALAGPFGTALLADLGADVIKIEPPQGDMTRGTPPHPPDFASPGSDREAGCDFGGYFASINRNKRSLVLDLKNPEDREVFLALADQADAVVENSRAGVMDRLGLGYETLSARNPKLVYGALRGFGDPRTGESPYVDWPAYDIVAQCMGGLAYINGPESETGFGAGASVGDIYPGTLLALGVVAAIYQAHRTGKGQFLDVAVVVGTVGYHVFKGFNDDRITEAEVPEIDRQHCHVVGLPDHTKVGSNRFFRVEIGVTPGVDGFESQR